MQQNVWRFQQTFLRDTGYAFTYSLVIYQKGFLYCLQQSFDCSVVNHKSCGSLQSILVYRTCKEHCNECALRAPFIKWGSVLIGALRALQVLEWSVGAWCGHHGNLSTMFGFQNIQVFVPLSVPYSFLPSPLLPTNSVQQYCILIFWKQKDGGMELQTEIGGSRVFDLKKTYLSIFFFTIWKKPSTLEL